MKNPISPGLNLALIFLNIAGILLAAIGIINGFLTEDPCEAIVAPIEIILGPLFLILAFLIRTLATLEH